MKSLTIALAIAAVLVTVPAWAATSGSFHALAKVSAAATLSSDELSEVEGGIITFGTQMTPVFTPFQSTFLGWVLQQQYGVGPFPPLVVNTSVIPSPAAGGGVTFVPNHQIRVNTLVCTGCFLP
jgi:hypothetical protein